MHININLNFKIEGAKTRNRRVEQNQIKHQLLNELIAEMTELKGFAHLVFYVCDQDPSSTHSHDHNETDHGHDHSHSNDLNYTFSHFKGHFIPMTIENADGKVKSAREGPSIHSNWAIIGIPCKNPPTLHHCW